MYFQFYEFTLFATDKNRHDYFLASLKWIETKLLE